MFGLKSKKKLKRTKASRKLITVLDAKSVVAEQFRTIRTNITFSMPEQTLQTILVTSATSGEGKSTTAANLGVVFAQEGKRVLLIDADMRKPTLHQTFKVYNKVGLSTVLAKKDDILASIQETFIVGLSIIPSGPTPPNPAELISSDMLQQIVSKVSDQFDLVIMDAPPLLPVADAHILSNKCDGILLVVNAGVVEKDAVIKAQKILETAQTKILGVVLNNYDMPKDYYNYSYGE